MFTLLTGLIFIIYIGLGIPDSSLGASWPAVYADLNLPVGALSFLTTITYIFTLTSSFFSAKLINKFGTGKIVAISTVLTAIALLGYSLSPNYYIMCLFAIPSGLGAGAIDASLNNYAAIHFKPSQMNFLHCFYGIGVTISPLIISFALNKIGDWRTGFRLIFFVQLFISLCAIVALPLFKKVKLNVLKDDFVPKTLTFKDMAKERTIRLAWTVFFFTTALEFACDSWLATYLVEVGNLSESIGARFTTLYFVGMASGRFTSGVAVKKLKSSVITYLGFIFIGIAIIIQFLPINIYVKGISFFLIGFGNGPIFPNFTHIVPSRFGKELSQSIVSSQMVFANIGLLISPILFSIIAQYISVKTYPVYLAVLLIGLIVFVLLYDRNLKIKYGKGI